MSQDAKTLLITPRFRVEELARVGSDGRLIHKSIVRHPGAVAIIPFLDDTRVCLIRNFRISVGDHLVEIPAGTLELGEDPQETAHRELVEETGYRAGRLTQVGRFFMSPGVLDERMHVFVATDLTAVPRCLDAGEEIENLIVKWDEAIDMVANGVIQDAKTVAALLLWHLGRTRCAPMPRESVTGGLVAGGRSDG